MRKLLTLLVCLFALCIQIFSQTRSLKGRIVDENGKPVSGASILIKGSKTGTITNSNGEFSLGVPENAKALVVSGIGFAEQELAIGAQNTLLLTLKAESRSLEEVVVTGYTREKKSQFVGAATTLDANKVIATVPVSSFDQALQGRAAGVQVNSGSGQPGANAQVWIRGVQSIGAAFTQPLYVIDGVPISQTAFQSLNPNDFESVTVLKDANASALYGSRGGQGVIVITTKKGKANATNIQYRFQVGFTERPQATNFDMMNSSEILTYEERIKIVGSPGWTYGKSNPAYNVLQPGYGSLAQQQARYNFLLDSLRNINTNTMDIFYRQGVSQTHELNMTGGSDKTRFYISGNYFNQQGTDKRADLKRYTVRFNLDHTVNKLSVQWNTLIGYSQTALTEGEWYGNSTRNTFQMSWRAKPYENPYRADGSVIYGASTALNPKVIGIAIEGVDNSTWDDNQLKLNSGLSLAYKLAKSLTLKNVLGLDANGDRYQRWIKPDSYIGSVQTYGKGYDIEAYRNVAQMVNTTSLTYAQRFNQVHDVEVSGYFEVLRQWQKAVGFQLYNLDPRLPETGQGAGALPVSGTTFPQNATSAKSGYGIRSIFGAGRYTYLNKYTVNASVRRDGTSRIINPENKEFTTWAVGASWNAYAEDFIRNIGGDWLSDLRVRASYGSVPNINSIAAGSYNVFGITSITNFASAQVPTYGSAPYAGSTVSGLAPTTPGNYDLSMETIQKTNLGLDIATFKNRLRLSTDFYYNKTVDLFVNQRLPFTAGFGVFNLVKNAGTMTNKGVELTLGADILRSKDWDLTLNMNHAINKNEITDLGIVDEFVSGTFLLKKGLPYGSHYVQHYLGADPATGKPMYEDANGKVTLDPANAPSMATFGTFLPKHVGGFGFDLRYKSLSVSALFSYQFDVVRYNNIESWVSRGISGYAAAVNQVKRLLTDQWRQPGDQKFFQSSDYDRGFTSADLQDAKFLRFRNLNFAYNIPALTIKGVHIISSARFYVQLQNIYIWSPWRGPDPEDSNNISLNEYPNPKMFVTGLDVNF